MTFLSDASEMFGTTELWLNLVSGCPTVNVRSHSILLMARSLENRFQSRTAYLSSEAGVVLVVVGCVCVCECVCVCVCVCMHMCTQILSTSVRPFLRHFYYQLLNMDR